MRDIPDPGFAGDDGAPDSRLRDLLVRAATGAHDPAVDVEALARLLQTRLLVPVVAMLGDQPADPAAGEKTSDMATVLIKGQDGRLGMLAFTGTDALARWDPGARPVPVPARQAARAAVDEGADALIVDIAGPGMLAVEGDDLRRVSTGHQLVRIGAGFGWLPPAGD